MSILFYQQDRSVKNLGQLVPGQLALAKKCRMRTIGPRNNFIRGQ